MIHVAGASVSDEESLSGESGRKVAREAPAPLRLATSCPLTLLPR